VLYVIFARPYRHLSRKTGSIPAVVLTLVCALVVVALPVGGLIALVANQAPDAMRSVQSGAFLERTRALRLGPFAIGPEIAKLSANLASWLPAQLLRFAGNAASAVLNLVIAFFGLYFLLRSGDRAWRAVRDYIPFTAATADELLADFFAMTEAVLVGWVLVAVTQGSVVAAGFAIAQLRDPLFWGAVTALGSVIPFVGSGLVWAPTTLILAAQGQYLAALIILVTGAIASSVDNVIRLFVYRRVSNIHPMITLIGVFIGVRYLGLLGLLMGPLAIAYLFELIRLYRQEYGSSHDRERRGGSSTGDDRLLDSPDRPVTGERIL